MKIVKTILLKIVIYTAVKNRCILRGHVFVMWYIPCGFDKFKSIISEPVMYAREQAIASSIMLTCPCNVHPISSHFYIVKLGFTGIYIIIFLL